MATKQIAVRFGKLTEPLEVVKIEAGMNISKFLEARGLEFGPSVMVNAEEVNEEYRLREGDIITDIDEVSGGR